MNFTAKQARNHYNSNKGVPLSIKNDIVTKLIEESANSTYLYIDRSETLEDGLLSNCYFNVVEKWLSSEDMGYKVTVEKYNDDAYDDTSYDYRLKVEW